MPPMGQWGQRGGLRAEQGERPQLGQARQGDFRPRAGGAPAVASEESPSQRLSRFQCDEGS